MLCYVPANVVPPDHHHAGTVACDHVRIARALEDKMKVTITLPSHIDTGVEAETDLVPKSDSIRRVNGRFGEALDTLHSILDGRLERRAPCYFCGQAGVDLELHVGVSLDGRDGSTDVERKVLVSAMAHLLLGNHDNGHFFLRFQIAELLGNDKVGPQRQRR